MATETNSDARQRALELMALLRSDEELLEEFRALLLTEELINLPARFEEHIRDYQRDMASITSILRTLVEHAEKVDERLDGMDERFDKMDGRLDKMDERMGRMDGRMDRMEADMGSIKGYLFENKMMGRKHSIVARLSNQYGLNPQMGSVREVSKEELAEMVWVDGLLPELTDSQRESFVETDIVLSFLNQSGDKIYVTAQASYTCASRDTSRAIFAADCISRITGEKALPAICGVRLDSRAERQVSRGEVYWYETEELRNEYARQEDEA